MRGGGLILALIVGAVFVALYAPLLLKASNELRSHRPDAFRSAATGDVETDALLGGRAKLAIGFHNHKSVSVLSRVSGGAL